MKQAANDIVVESATPVAQVIVYLEQLVHALKSGAVHVRHGDYEVVLGPRDVVDFEVSAKARNKRHRLSLQLTWRSKTHTPDAELELRFAPDQGNHEMFSPEESPVSTVEVEPEAVTWSRDEPGVKGQAATDERTA